MVAVEMVEGKVEIAEEVDRVEGESRGKEKREESRENKITLVQQYGIFAVSRGAMRSKCGRERLDWRRSRFISRLSSLK